MGLSSEYASATKLTAVGARYVVGDMRDLAVLFDEIKDNEQVVTTDEEG